MNKKPPSPIEPKIATAATITVIGLGNIGSWLAALLVRMQEVSRLILVDDDDYDSSNLVGQNITTAAIGSPKVAVQEEHLAKIRSEDLILSGIPRRIEDVPLGVLAQSDLLIGAVDSKAARQTISEIAFRLGIPYLDCGVNTTHSIARLSFFDPRHDDSACIECAWGPNDYAALEAKKSCNGVPATAGSAHLGALSASTAASAVVRYLQRGFDTCLDVNTATPARQASLEAFTLNALCGGIARNRNCHFDHRTMVREFAAGKSPDDSLATFLNDVGLDSKETFLGVPGVSWIVEHRCKHCIDSTIRRPSLHDRPLSDPPTCPDCGAPASPVGFSATEVLSSSDLLPDELDAPLASFGIEAGDILAVSATEDGPIRYIELPHEYTSAKPTDAAA